MTGELIRPPQPTDKIIQSKDHVMHLATESHKAMREVVGRSLASLFVISAGCLFGWGIVHFVNSLIRAELLVLRGALPYYP